MQPASPELISLAQWIYAAVMLFLLASLFTKLFFKAKEKRLSKRAWEHQSKKEFINKIK